ncbi:hypothetical protein LINPERHAP1_LOCUS18869 [Linum perenne]
MKIGLKTLTTLTTLLNGQILHRIGRCYPLNLPL